MTRMTPPRRMIRHLSQMRLTLALTFMFSSHSSRILALGSLERPTHAVGSPVLALPGMFFGCSILALARPSLAQDQGRQIRTTSSGRPAPDYQLRAHQPQASASILRRRSPR